MEIRQNTTSTLEDLIVNVKIKLAALWIVLMFLYAYVDILGFYKPGTVENILNGIVWEFEISQVWATSALLLMTVPIVMIFLSMTLKPAVNRWVNIIVAGLYIIISAGNAIGETWIFMWIGAAVEIAVLALVIWYASTWPRSDGSRD
ncbi:MAG: DUF6326 family protein [Chloroflexota bacterium]